MTNKNRPLWGQMLRYAVRVCGMSPNDFWNLTMPEFLELVRTQTCSSTEITRRELDALIATLK